MFLQALGELWRRDNDVLKAASDPTDVFRAQGRVRALEEVYRIPSTLLGKVE